jgi:hypothetical protein
MAFSVNPLNLQGSLVPKTQAEWNVFTTKLSTLLNQLIQSSIQYANAAELAAILNPAGDLTNGAFAAGSVTGGAGGTLATGTVTNLNIASAGVFNSSLFYKTQATSSAVDVSIDCVNACGVAAYMTWTTTARTLTLAHLAPGVPVAVAFFNNSGSTGTFAMAATNPAGVAYSSVNWKTSTANTNMTSTGISMTNGLFLVASGSAIAGSLMPMVAN